VIDNRQRKLIGLLADGRFYSGRQLAIQLGISKSAISRRISRLSDLGLDVDSVKGKGYCLRAPIELLDKQVICGALGSGVSSKIECLSIQDITASTNTDALESRITTGYGVFLSEYQTGGKGRRGKSWYQGFASGLVLSIVKNFELDLKELSAMSLWSAVAVCEVLSHSYGDRFKIKWPNDIYVDGRKLAGILLEAKTEVGGQVRLVVGVGVNYVAQHIKAERIDQSWTALSQLQGHNKSNRSILVASIIERIIFRLDRVLTPGFKSDLAEYWSRYDYLVGRDICVSSIGGRVEGHYEGLDSSGNLLLSHNGRLVSVNAGEVSVREIDH